jgi:5-methylcytosine-specific restriction protein A
MPNGQWAGSTRRATLGREFFRNRARALRRDGYRCQLRIPNICTGAANQGDHIGDRLDHSVENLQAACPECHAHKSSQQGGAGRGRAARARAAARQRPAEPHPGALEPARQPARRAGAQHAPGGGQQPSATPVRHEPPADGSGARVSG